MAQVVEWKTGIPKVQGSHLTPNILKLCVSGHGLSLIYNFLSKQGNVMVKMVEQLISKFKVVGSTPTTLFYFIFIFFIHIFIILTLFAALIFSSPLIIFFSSFFPFSVNEGLCHEMD